MNRRTLLKTALMVFAAPFVPTSPSTAPVTMTRQMARIRFSKDFIEMTEGAIKVNIAVQELRRQIDNDIFNATTHL